MSTPHHVDSHLIRSQPNDTAPNAPSPLIYSVISWITYLIYLALLPVYVPYLVLLHYLMARPFESWTLERRVTTRLAKLQVILNGYWLPPLPWNEWGIAPPGGEYLEAQRKEEIRIEVVKLRPVQDTHVKGIAAAGRGSVQAEVRPGFWITPKGGRKTGDEIAGEQEKVILHIHGGGYIRGHPLWTPFAGDIAKLTGSRCLSVNYRKTLSASSAFPAPLLDALSAYIHLTETLQFKPSNIIFLGESAGAHLALFLSQYLRDIGFPQPGYIALSSPWADFGLSYPSHSENAAYDQLSPIRLGRAVKSAMRNYVPRAKDHPYFSPAKAHAENWVYLKKEGTRVYIHYGGKELFRDEIVSLGSKMREAKVDVRMRVDPEGLHTSGMIAGAESGRTFRKDLLEMLS